MGIVYHAPHWGASRNSAAIPTEKPSVGCSALARDSFVFASTERGGKLQWNGCIAERRSSAAAGRDPVTGTPASSGCRLELMLGLAQTPDHQNDERRP